MAERDRTTFINRNPTDKAPRITKQDAEQIADCVARRMTETEACALLELPYKAWINWKLRPKNKSDFDGLIMRLKALRLKNALDNIDDAANGRRGIRHDWRAAAFLAGVTGGWDRYGQQPIANQALVQVNVLTDDKMRELEQRYANSKALVACGVEKRLIEDKSGTNTTSEQNPQ